MENDRNQIMSTTSEIKPTGKVKNSRKMGKGGGPKTSPLAEKVHRGILCPRRGVPRLNCTRCQKKKRSKETNAVQPDGERGKGLLEGRRGVPIEFPQNVNKRKSGQSHREQKHRWSQRSEVRRRKRKGRLSKRKREKRSQLWQDPIGQKCSNGDIGNGTKRQSGRVRTRHSGTK